ALLTVIFALVIIALLSTAGLFASHQELRIASAGENAEEALRVAENGIASVLAEWDPVSMDSLANWEADTLTGTISGEGNWQV
ncbi:MAG: hypothetical protein GWM92_16165, partial [Gemmatimonadetes bacterium]|nr:hypothetical protein [Gemmatimonadota bacterium]NIR79718.1 hypothetical protein [Gemmatimonadota bacterium]NIT89051.1 hypothetical protein [Gemmatimonadota bacterium]NIU32846.1 hypothetical protein [Gemmatimonadota bacterium]NIU37259.1 hypothetical protein [Gemmatimonadota bacterium]